MYLSKNYKSIFFKTHEGILLLVVSVFGTDMVYWIYSLLKLTVAYIIKKIRFALADFVRHMPFLMPVTF